MRRLAVALCLTVAAAAPSAALAGETRCWLDRGVVMVPAGFGHIAGDFILDLSSPVSVLHWDVAVGEDILTPTTTSTLRLAGERIPTTLAVQSLDYRSYGMPTTINGLIGADALAGYVVDLRLSPCRLRLWKGRAPPLEGARSLPVALAQGVPSIAATVSDGHTTRQGRFAIDTGAWGMRLSSGAAWFSRLPGPSVDPASRLAPPARIGAISVDGETVRNAPASLEGDLPPELLGAIGTAVWRRYELRLDLPRRRLELAPVKP